LHLAVSLEFYGDLVAFASHDVPTYAVIHAHKAPDRFAIHGQDFVAGLQANFLCRRIGQNITDHGGRIRFAHRMADGPDNGRKEKRQKQAE
jgi:hypothetical protein